MSLSKHKNVPSYDFPEEILCEVFKRLPVKYVLRCGAVQKSWYSLIKTPLFISHYCNYRKLTGHIDPKYLLFHNLDNNSFAVRSDNKQCQEYCIFSYPLGLPASSWYVHSNGLICVSTMFDEEFDYNRSIYIWNPLVQKFKAVPESPLYTLTFMKATWNALAFGFLPEINDYVVVHIIKFSSSSESLSFNSSDPSSHVKCEHYPHSVIIGVYSLNTNSWRKICQDKGFVNLICSSESVFVNGTAYWAGIDSSFQSVMCFDTNTNILRKIRVHNLFPDLDVMEYLIIPFGESIAYCIEGNENNSEEDEEDYWSPHLHIWLLKDSVTGEDNKIGELFWEMRVSLDQYVWAQVLGTRNNGDPILAKSNSLIAYDLDTQELMTN
ncbi:putative F-box protein At3g10430 [Apium graveolens]|uniref:putative F-box protein At3g10430 n=1 Tax=Apium graveolens TaxID=4045 RepID=UPI003D7AD02F